MPNNFIDGAGPYRLQLDESLAPGDTVRFPLADRHFKDQGSKGFHTRRVPYDAVLMKNLSTDVTLRFEFNRVFESIVQPNAADDFSEQGVTHISVTNVSGSNSIDPDEVIIQIKKEPYDADDAARAERKRSPVQNMIRGVLNL